MKPLILAAALATTMLSGTTYATALTPSDCDRAPWGDSAAYKALQLSGLPDFDTAMRSLCVLRLDAQLGIPAPPALVQAEINLHGPGWRDAITSRSTVTVILDDLELAAAMVAEEDLDRTAPVDVLRQRAFDDLEASKAEPNKTLGEVVRERHSGRTEAQTAQAERAAAETALADAQKAKAQATVDREAAAKAREDIKAYEADLADAQRARDEARAARADAQPKDAAVKATRAEADRLHAETDSLLTEAKTAEEQTARLSSEKAAREQAQRQRDNAETALAHATAQQEADEVAQREHDLEHAKKLSVAFIKAQTLCGNIGLGAAGAGAACKAMGQLDNQLQQYGCNPGGGSVSCHGTIFTMTPYLANSANTVLLTDDKTEPAQGINPACANAKTRAYATPAEAQAARHACR